MVHLYNEILLSTKERESEREREREKENYQTMKKIARNFKCILLSRRSQFEKATYYMIPTIRHFGKGKTTETVKSLVVGRG